MSSLHTLLPTFIEPGTPQHEAVDSLRNAINKKGVLNIAITGAYGSGKTSVIDTYLHEEAKKAESKYCKISLATIEALNDTETGRESSEENREEAPETKTPEDKVHDAKLNRRIEYSILQQLIYKEKHTKLPKSRFKKIPFISKKKAWEYSLWIVSCIICWLIAFEPKILRIDSLYTFFEDHLGIGNFIADCAAISWLIISTCYVVYKVIRHYSGLSVKKVSVANADIDIDEERSIFNDYLEEIIYFFQESGYNLVFIEDLDRFDSTYIFLKLRELNNLLNSSNMLDSKPIRFVYAIRDDMFVDSGRTKFFDEIIPVIPIVNPHNAAEKLKENLTPFGLQDKVPTEDLKAMSYFIKDMRLLKNIANEFYLYYKMMEVDTYHLNPTKLLAMMIYKNLYPHDFGRLPNREGKLYELLSPNFKNEVAKFAKEKVLKERKEYWNRQKEIREHTSIENLEELRKMYLLALYLKCDFSENYKIIIDNKLYTLNEIAKSENLFDSLTSSSQISYQFRNRYSSLQTDSSSLDFLEIEKTVNDKVSYKERAKALEIPTKDIDEELRKLDLEEKRIGNMPLAVLLTQFSEILDEESQIDAPYMMKFFVRKGYIDENYYDYISYFYNGLTSDKDHDTLMRIKAKQAVPFNQQIDNVKGLISEIPKDLWSTDYSLINAVCDYIFDHPVLYKEEEDLILYHLDSSDRAIEFLLQYLFEGAKYDVAFESYVNHDKEKSWNQFRAISGNNGADMISEWLRVVNLVDSRLPSDTTQWLSNNYTLLRNNMDTIGEEQTYKIAGECLFIHLDEQESSLLDYVCDKQLYDINNHNLTVLTNTYNEREIVTEDNLNLTRIFNTKHESLINDVKENIDDVIDCLINMSKDDDEEALLYVLNNQTLSDEKKKAYLSEQQNRVSDINKITESDAKRLSMETFVLSPSWENISIFISEVKGQNDSILERFIKSNISTLQQESSATNVDGVDGLFNKVVNSNLIEMPLYSQVVDAFKGYQMTSEINDSLDTSKLSSLIDAEIIPYNDTYKAQLMSFDGKAYGLYLENYWDSFQPTMSEKDLTIPAVNVLLNSNKLSVEDKKAVIRLTPIQFIEANKDIATTISKILSSSYTVYDYPTMYSIIRQSQDESSRIKVAISTIQQAIEDHSETTVIENVIQCLGGEYLQLLDSGKKPLYDNTPLNKDLFDTLKSADFISSYQEEKKGLRVNLKRKA